jgi:hypothetical protein
MRKSSVGIASLLVLGAAFVSPLRAEEPEVVEPETCSAAEHIYTTEGEIKVVLNFGDPFKPIQCETYYNMGGGMVDACACEMQAIVAADSITNYHQLLCSGHQDSTLTVLDAGLTFPLGGCPSQFVCEGMGNVTVEVFVESRCCWPGYPQS